VTGAKPAVVVAGIGDRHTAQMRADTQAHHPLHTIKLNHLETLLL
jgi:hypothetical protein